MNKSLYCESGRTKARENPTAPRRPKLTFSVCSVAQLLYDSICPLETEWGKRNLAAI